MSFPTDSQRTIASMKSYELVKKLRQKNIDMKGARLGIPTLGTNNFVYISIDTIPNRLSERESIKIN
jgi:hypothetical protein